MRAAAGWMVAAALVWGQETPLYRTSTDEVLVDVVVRDRRGRQVKDLRLDEVEVLENGAAQTLKALRRVEGGTVEEIGRSGARQAGRLDPLRNLRLVMLVFDRLSAGGRILAREALREMLKNDPQPNTFYGVVQLDPEFKVVQKFTSDRILVRWAVERVTGVKGAQSEGAPAIGRPTAERTEGDPVAAQMAQAVAEMEGRMAELEAGRRGATAMNGLLSMVLGLRQIEGRKTAVLFSEGLSGGAGLLRAVIGQANRNNVAFYTVDARGLKAGAAPEIVPEGGWRAGVRTEGPEARQRAAYLEELASATGGFATADTNDVKAPLRRLTEDAGGYYLLSYTPQDKTWDGRFRQVEVRVKRAGVAVQARSGYFALPPGMQVLVFPHEVALLRALSMNPLPRQVEFRAGLYHFGAMPKEKVQCLFQIEIPIRNLSLRKNEAAGTYEMHASFLVLIKDSAGRAVRKATRDVPFSGPLDKLEGFLAGNFVYNDYFPLAPGRYVMESAVADRVGERLGTKRVSFIVPEVRAGQLALSSLVRVKRVESGPAPEVQYGEGDDRGENPLRCRWGQVTPALEEDVRDRLSFYFVVQGGQGPKPRLVIEFRKDGAVISRSTPELGEAEGGRYPYYASAPLAALAAGHYELRVAVVQDGQATEARLGFEVVR